MGSEGISKAHLSLPVGVGSAEDLAVNGELFDGRLEVTLPAGGTGEVTFALDGYETGAAEGVAAAGEEDRLLLVSIIQLRAHWA